LLTDVQEFTYIKGSTVNTTKFQKKLICRYLVGERVLKASKELLVWGIGLNNIRRVGKYKEMEPKKKKIINDDVAF
jgi:hypothetical protein